MRQLPDYYVPGGTITVTLTVVPEGCGVTSFAEKIPPRWYLVDIQYPMAMSSQGTVRWLWYEYPNVIDAWPPESIWYTLMVPLDASGEVVFTGRFENPGCTGPQRPIEGDSVVSERVGLMRYRPLWATIQQTIDTSEWGDRIMVSAAEAPFVENIVMKPGINLVGFVDSPSYFPPSYDPPVIEAASPDEPAITAGPYTKISGFIIRSSSVGIRVQDPTVEISNCVITGMQDAAIEYVGVTEGKITNCTIVGNDGVGILCHEPSPGVVVSNSILYANGGKDVENCTARFCLLEDDIEPGSGENNIFADPMFVNAAEGDYRLLRGSPCIDAGDGAGIGPEDVDILGKPRILFGGKSETVDLGAYEYWFISASRLPGTAHLQLRWSSRPEKTYSVFFSDDLITWQLADDNVPSAGGSTLWLDPIGWPPSVPTRFYRITEDE